MPIYWTFKTLLKAISNKAADYESQVSMALLHSVSGVRKNSFGVWLQGTLNSTSSFFGVEQ
jgi:hypothetical protein